MNKTQSTLHFEMDANGSVINIALIDNQGRVVANAAQLSGIGGIRRFILDVSKEAEKESADNAKISVAKKISEHMGVDVKKMKPDANGRISELIRVGHNLGDNRAIIEQWDDEGIEGVTKEYVLRMVELTLELVKDEMRTCLEKGKIDKEFLERELTSRKIPKWFYDTLTAKNGVTPNMQEPIDYLFPKNNYQNGVSFRFKELTDSFLESHWIITKGNEPLIEMLKKYISDFTYPTGRDADRVAKLFIDNLKVVLLPNLSAVEMIERYKDAKHKDITQAKTPEGEAGYAIRKKLNGFNTIQDTWHEYFRFNMFKEIDADAYWSKIVDPQIYGGWNLTAQQNTRYWVNELDEGDISLSMEWRTGYYGYALNKLGIYSTEKREEFISNYGMHDYKSCEEKGKLAKESAKQHEESKKDLLKWEKDHNAMPEGTDKEKEEKNNHLQIKPGIIPVRDIKSIPTWGYNLGNLFIRSPKNINTMVDDIKAKFPGPFEYGKILNLDRYAKIDVEDETIQKYQKYFKGISAKHRETNRAIGIADALSETSAKAMNELNRNEKYGKVLKPKVEGWLVTTFAGSVALQEIAAESIVQSVKNQDFYVEAEE
jgi:hypothetical protein